MTIPAEIEYQTLRDEIICEMEMQTNLRIAMCTIAVAMLAIALEQKSPYLCLAVFGVLIPFRLLIHSKQAGILRISAYLIAKYESKYKGLTWESVLAHQLRNISNRKIRLFSTVSRLGYYVSTIFGAMTVISYFFLQEQLQWYHMVILSACMLTVIVLDFAFDNEVIREAYRQEFEKIIH